MKEVNRYSGEVVLYNGKKRFYMGPTMEGACELCHNDKDMVSYKVIQRSTNMTVARYTKESSPYNTQMSLKTLYEQDDKLNENYVDNMIEVAIASC
jgi:hypothetical protein